MNRAKQYQRGRRIVGTKCNRPALQRCYDPAIFLRHAAERCDGSHALADAIGGPLMPVGAERCVQHRLDRWPVRLHRLSDVQFILANLPRPGLIMIERALAAACCKAKKKGWSG